MGATQPSGIAAPINFVERERHQIRSVLKTETAYTVEHGNRNYRFIFSEIIIFHTLFSLVWSVRRGAAVSALTRCLYVSVCLPFTKAHP